MAANSKELTDRFVQLTEQVYDDIRARPLLEEWLDVELTLPQLRALLLLHKGVQRMGDLAAGLGVTLPSATSVVDRLVGKELVERSHDERDRRVVTCVLTEAGRTAVERFWRIGRSRAERVAGLLDAAQLAKVVEAMEIMAAAVSAHRLEMAAEVETESPVST
ncbi:MAG: MarR family transcriptional regulator [Dehalococcoidia bacterium]